MCVNKRALCEPGQPVRQKPIILLTTALSRFMGNVFFLFGNTSTYLPHLHLLSSVSISMQQVGDHSPLCTSMLTSLPLGHLLSMSTTWL